MSNRMLRDRPNPAATVKQRTPPGDGAIALSLSSRRILTLCYEHPPLGGGGGRVARDLAERLGELGFATDFVTMALPTGSGGCSGAAVTLHEVAAPRKSPIVCSAVEMVPYLARGLIRALRLHRHYRHDVNLSHFILPDGLICLALRKLEGLPYLLTAHGSDVPGYNPDRFKLLHRLIQPIWRLVVRNADRIVCPSATVQGLVRAACPQARTTVVPNGIDIHRFDPARPKRDRILTVTRMVERKGVQYLIEALAGIEAPFALHVVGDGPYLPALRTLAAARGVDAVFHGALANDSVELRELYETSRMFAFVSTTENFPLVLLEAMAAGAAITTTAGTGCAEAVGDCAELVPPADAIATRTALVRLMGDPDKCARLGAAARQRVERLFATDIVVKRYAELVDAAVRTSGGRVPRRVGHSGPMAPAGVVRPVDL